MSIVSISFLVIRLVAVGMLIWGAIGFQLTSYYTLLRWIAFILGTLTAFKFFKFENYAWIRIPSIIISASIAILYNPIFLVHLTHRIWSIIDIVAAIFFLLSIIVMPKYDLEKK